MNQRDYFKDIYVDFFGVEKDGKEIVDDSVKMGSQEEMTSCFEMINGLAITDDSKDTLKKIIEYMRKYEEGIEVNYIPFHVVIDGNNDKIINDINDILYREAKYFKYVDNDKN